MHFKSTADGSSSKKWRAACAASAFIALLTPSWAHAANLQWAGRTWKVTSGGMAGVAAGSPSNVSVDSDGYLHLKITNTAGTWTASELFTTDNLGFGTYQWQVDGPIDRFDKNVVLGLFPYGPAAGIGQDGTNEIDIEYSVWGHAGGVNADWTDYPSSGKTIGETSYNFSLNGGTYSTSRFIWNSASIQDFLITGFQPVGSTTDLVKTWTYAPSDPTTNIPQQAMPLGINLWCFDAPPSDGKDVEVVIRDFEFVAEGTSPGGAGGMGGMSSAGANAGGMSQGGASQGGANQGGNNAGGAAGTSTGAGTGGMTIAGGSGAGASGMANSTGGATNAAGNPGTSGATSIGAGGAATSSAGASGATANGGDSTSGSSGSSDSGGCSFSSAHGHHPQWALLYPLPLLVLGRRLRRRPRRAQQTR
jgi:hypothetical protein